MKTKFKGAHLDYWDDPCVGMFASQVVKLAISISETCAIDPVEMLEAVMQTADTAIEINVARVKEQ